MQLIFLGTGSQMPRKNRGVSAIALRFTDGEIWLFDCGEGTQVQISSCRLRPSKITKIFITHLHGDHVLGLPGLLHTLSSQELNNGDKFILELYGPVGLRAFVHSALNLSREALTYAWVVHELEPLAVQYSAGWAEWPQLPELPEHHLLPGEVKGRVVTPDGSHVWKLWSSSTGDCCASWLQHRVPSFGFVVEEPNTAGVLDVARLQELGVPKGPLYGDVKRGKTITLPCGKSISPADVVGPDKLGRKVVILGDTSDSSAIRNIAADCHVLVHEATLEDALQEKAMSRGHSTPSMAVNFARSVGASNLILTHFSIRYTLPGEPGGDKSTDDLLLEARAAMTSQHDVTSQDNSMTSRCEVACARDFMQVDISRPSKCNQQPARMTITQLCS